jgi:hypothetical protein
LNDNWDYAPDDTITRKVFADLDLGTIFPQSPSQPSQLCHRCIDLRVWSITCTFVDSPKGLEEKANKERCALCRLLLQGIQTRVKRNDGFVRFARAGSYLTYDGGQGQAIANLYTMPGMSCTHAEFTNLYDY